MNFSFSTLRNAGLVAGLTLVVGANAASTVDLFPNYESYIKITGKAASVTGSPSAYARRMQMPENGSYGIEALRVNREIDDKTSVAIEGKAMLGSENYLAAVTINKAETGTFDFGYKRYRTFYDGIGGFFPLNGRWMQLANPELHTDRAKFWAGAKIEVANAPKFEFRYTNEQRTGKKDTTIWGDTDFTGVPVYYGTSTSGASALNLYSSNRKIVPNYINLDERQQNWFGSVAHHVGNTELEFEFLHNTAKSGDKRSVVRYPGELQLFPRQTATSTPQIYPPETVSNMVVGYDKQIFDGRITSYTGKFETKFTDQVTVFGGLLYSKGSAKIGGDRQMTQYLPTAIGQVAVVGGHVGTSGRPPYSYTTLDGKVNERVTAWNFGVKVQPVQDLTARFAVKYEKTDVDGYNTTVYTSNRVDQTTGAVTPIVVNAPNLADRTEKTWLPEADIRYSATKDLSLYGNFEYRRSPGDEFGSSTGVGTGGLISGPVVSNTDVKLNHKHYKVGANWKLNQIVSLRGEVFYKDHTNGFYSQTTAGDSFVMGYQFTGVKLTGTVKPQSNLNFTSRFIRQSGKMDTTIDGGASMKANDTQVYTFGETIDWAPTASSYVQANVNVVYNTIKSGYPQVGLAGNDVLRNTDNNYRNGSLITGWVVDKDTDASIQYTFYRADNYKVPTAATVWYGAGVKEYTYAFAVKHRFNKDLVGQFKVGYFNSDNQTTGGNTNFKGPMAYVSFDHAL